jgi:hypothetical protein
MFIIASVACEIEKVVKILCWLSVSVFHEANVKCLPPFPPARFSNQYQMF